MDHFLEAFEMNHFLAPMHSFVRTACSVISQGVDDSIALGNEREISSSEPE